MSSHWTPAFSRHIPITGLLALIGVAISAAGIMTVLCSSNGKPINGWIGAKNVQPAQLLAVFSATANGLLRLALSEAATISWWDKALRGGTVADFHRYWLFGISFQSAILSGRNMNLVAVACILTSVVVIDGPLLQRASLIKTRPSTHSISLNLPVSSSPLPYGFTGLYCGRNAGINLLTPHFAQVARDHSNRSTIVLPEGRGCLGSCSTTVIAAGFDIDCQEAMEDYAMISAPAATSRVGGVNISFSGTNYETSNQMVISALWKPDALCAGKLRRKTCTLQSGTIRYPINIVNNTLRLLEKDPAANDTVTIDKLWVETHGMGFFKSTLGGISLLAQNLYGGSVVLYFGGIWQVQAEGTFGFNYIDSPESSYGSCNMTWADPISDILSGVRELMFRSAIAASNATSMQTVAAVQTEPVAYYESNYTYLAVALVLMLVDTMAIFPLFLGWWCFGRQVSLSPLETARAFGAPDLTVHGTNSEVTKLLCEIGSQHFRYGAVSVGPIEDNLNRIPTKEKTAAPSEDQNGDSAEENVERDPTEENLLGHSTGQVLDGDSVEEDVCQNPGMEMLLFAIPRHVSAPVKGKRYN